MKPKVDTNACSGCGICADECPNGAITVNGTAVIDKSVCTGCGVCVEACPMSALSVK